MLMEALQMLKFSLRQKRVDFMNGWSVSERDMHQMVDDEPDLLAMVPTNAPAKKSLDKVLSAIGQGNDDDDDDENLLLVA